MHAGFAGVVQDRFVRPRGFGHADRLAQGVDSLPGVGATLAKRLRALGIVTVGDVLVHVPRRYERAADEVAISQLWGDEEVAIAGVVREVRTRRIGGRRTIVTARVEDAGGSISASWFNQPWLVERLSPGTHVRLRGKLGRYGFDVKSYDVGETRATADFAPVYPASEQVPSWRVRELARTALDSYVNAVRDPLPASLDLPLRRDALHAIHLPASEAEAELARRRLALDELVSLQLAVARARDDDAVAAALPPPGDLVARYREALPFVLTPHQESAIAQIDHDLARPVPMQRLLQGDVGSGKTVVALYALLRAVESGRQGALMAPTETLAEQHFLTIEGLCGAVGVRCVLLTGSAGSKRARDAIAAGEAQVAVGTHALIQREVEFADLAVAVVDEQHRFGVEQRKALSEGRSPHVLHMTATPIPRTLALTIYGDLMLATAQQGPTTVRAVAESGGPTRPYYRVGEAERSSHNGRCGADLA